LIELTAEAHCIEQIIDFRTEHVDEFTDLFRSQSVTNGRLQRREVMRSTLYKKVRSQPYGETSKTGHSWMIFSLAMFHDDITDSEMAGESRSGTEGMVSWLRGVAAFRHLNAMEGKAIQIPVARPSLIIAVKPDRDWMVGWDSMT
jgi:hypothetical protein